jgi:putative restriction endonuclease
MNSFIVMQGETYQEEKELGIICSPQRDKGDNVPHSWKRMMEVKKDDLVFHYVRGEIVAISIANEDCTVATIPTEENGYVVSLTYHELENPINVYETFDEILPLLPIKYSAFKPNAHGNSGYLYPCNDELVIKLLELISELHIYQINEEQLELSVDDVKVTERNTLLPIVAETESNVKTKIRIEQQKFRKNVMPLWKNKCALCNIELPELLKATYSKPWKDSINNERSNPYNGLLLCHNHDALYKEGFIAFDGQGRLHISSIINEEDYVMYSLKSKAKIQLHSENKPYFKWHKKHIFQTR